VLEKAINDAMKVGEAEINELKGGGLPKSYNKIEYDGAL
jgi:hypothetical protein